MEEITTKNTKSEILDAYEDLLKKVKNAKAEMPKQVQEEKQRTEVVAKVSNLSNDGIVKEISSLKISLNSSLDQLEKNLSNEFKKLEDIRLAIDVEKKNLEDLYALSANTDSLAAMILVQKERKEKFEKQMVDEETSFKLKMQVERENLETEMNSLRELWKTEKLKQTAEIKEFAEEQKKQRQRGEEEYLYNLKIGRQKENDAYETKKASLEKELHDKKSVFEHEITKREELVKTAEQEFAELRKVSAEFPKKLDDAVNSKEKEITEKMKTQFEFERKLSQKQFEGDLKLKEQTIISLQEKIAEMQASLKELSQKATRYGRLNSNFYSKRHIVS